jgi:putative membrane protein
MWLFGVLLVVGVALLVVVAVRAVAGGVSADGRSGRSPRDRSSARRLLDERYARGDLSTDEYRERLRVLGEGG